MTRAMGTVSVLLSLALAATPPAHAGPDGRTTTVGDLMGVRTTGASGTPFLEPPAGFRPVKSADVTS